MSDKKLFIEITVNRECYHGRFSIWCLRHGALKTKVEWFEPIRERAISIGLKTHLIFAVRGLLPEIPPFEPKRFGIRFTGFDWKVIYDNIDHIQVDCTTVLKYTDTLSRLLIWTYDLLAWNTDLDSHVLLSIQLPPHCLLLVLESQNYQTMF